jgi:phage terminase large subunit-like protein
MQPRDVLGLLRIEDGRSWLDAAYPFQREDALAVLEGERPYSFLTRARGASKTCDLAAVALALLLTAERRERAYWLAADQEQGRLAVDAVVGYCDRTPTLRDALTVTASAVEAKATGARLDVLAADAASSWGLRPAAVFVDELTMWQDARGQRQLWEAVSSACAKRADARLVVLCTAGDPAHFSRRILDHALTSPLWRVNEVPGPCPWMTADRLAEQRARLLPSTSARLFENLWTASEDRLASPEELRECVTLDGSLEPDPARRYLIGLDVGLKRDRTVAAVAHREDRRVVLDRMAVWQGSRLRPVKLEAVEEWLIEASARYNRARVVLDPWQAVGTLQRLKAKGVRADEHPFTPQSVGRLAASLFNAIRDRALALPADEDLLDELAHVRLRESSPGVFRLDHDAGRHDDRAIALGLVVIELLRSGVPSEARILTAAGRIPDAQLGRGSTAPDPVSPRGNVMPRVSPTFPPGTPDWQRQITRRVRGGR